jgi:hypothetical protein
MDGRGAGEFGVGTGEAGACRGRRRSGCGAVPASTTQRGVASRALVSLRSVAASPGIEWGKWVPQGLGESGQTQDLVWFRSLKFLTCIHFLHHIRQKKMFEVLNINKKQLITQFGCPLQHKSFEPS